MSFSREATGGDDRRVRATRRHELLEELELPEGRAAGYVREIQPHALGGDQSVHSAILSAPVAAARTGGAGSCPRSGSGMYLSRRDLPTIAQRFNVGDARSALHKSRRDG